MKKFMFLFVAMFAIMLAATSCTSAESDLSETMAVNQVDGVTIQRLQKYNEVMMAQRPQTRSGGNSRLIAAHDISGAFSSIKAGQILAGAFGLASGGTGYAATVIGCGILGGAAASYKKYRAIHGYEARVEDFYKYSLNTLITNLKSDTTNYYKKYVYSPKSVSIKLPTKFQSLMDVGEAHNKLILGTNYNSPSTQSIVIKGPVDNWTPPVFTLEKVKVQNALSSKDFKNDFDKIISGLTSSDNNGQLDIDAFFKKCPTGSKRAEQALKDYLSLFTTYPKNVDDLIKITNDYVEIIESSNEFTDDEKAMIYAGLMVSIYSPQIWDGFE